MDMLIKMVRSVLLTYFSYLPLLNAEPGSVLVNKQPDLLSCSTIIPRSDLFCRVHKLRLCVRLYLFRQNGFQKSGAHGCYG